MFKKMKNTSIYSILLLVALLVFCCIFGSRNKLYTEGLTGSTSTGLTDFIYHSGAAHDLPTPLDWKGTPQGLWCNISNTTPHSSLEVDSFEDCKKLFKKTYPTNTKTGVMHYFDLQENEKGKDYHNCGVSDISNCELVSSSWDSPSIGRRVTGRGYTLPNTIIKQPSAPASMSNCQSPYFSEPKQCPDKNFLFWNFPTHVEQQHVNHGVLGSLKDAGENCSKKCTADKNCKAWLTNSTDGVCLTFPVFNKGDTAKFSCKNNIGNWQGCVKADVKSQGVNFIDVTPKPSPPPPPPAPAPPPAPPAPAPPPPSGKCVPNVPALLVANNPALNNVSAAQCPTKTRQEDCGPLPAFPMFGTPPCPQCCVWQPL